MRTYALRLIPGDDLRNSLEDFVINHKINAGIILTAVGSLKNAKLRLANGKSIRNFIGPFEIVSLVGTFSLNGSHLHLSVSDKEGKTFGGHLKEGSLIYTTAEIIIGHLENKILKRNFDPNTGFEELVVIDK